VPSYHLLVEATLFIWVLWLIMRKKRTPGDKIRLTEQVVKITLKDKLLSILVIYYYLGRRTNHSSLESKTFSGTNPRRRRRRRRGRRSRGIMGTG
jgi:hypothetical protein